MKCIQCDTDNNLQDRTASQGRCKNCQHPFVFDPKAGSRFTDVFFKNAIRTISAENSLYFTPKQFFYTLERRLGRKPCGPYIWMFLCLFSSVFTFGFSILLFPLVCLFGSVSPKTRLQSRKIYNRLLQAIGGIIIVGGILFGLAFSSVPVVGFGFFTASIALGLGLIYFARKQLSRLFFIPQNFSVKISEVDSWIDRWTQVNNSIAKMLPPPQEETNAVEISSDITAYSFDRVIICDSAAVAQLLIANNFHFENNCAVLSVTGYPQSIFSTVLEMLYRNPDLKVYAFHDATPRGVGLVNHLRTSNNWFGNRNVTIYDLGLLPRHVFASKTMFVQQSSQFVREAKQIPPLVRQGLNSDELKWLELGNYVELEFFTPRRLLQVAVRGIARSRNANSADSMTSIYGNGDNSYGIEDNILIFASDSFG